MRIDWERGVLPRGADPETMARWCLGGAWGHDGRYVEGEWAWHVESTIP